jgi:lysophospholipase L1-like esterase
MTSLPVNWVFLGDSLTEGMGSKHASYVSELADLLRESVHAGVDLDRSIQVVRFREVHPSFHRSGQFNLAGHLARDPHAGNHQLWLWNLASESTTVESDHAWLGFVRILSPSVVVVWRGGLESIIRPAMLRDGSWPWWVPQAWRGFVAMDPRCYFSSTWWRKAKQATIDALKQRARLALLCQKPGAPLVPLEKITADYESLLSELCAIAPRVIVCGLLPVPEDRFPGSDAYFCTVNERLRELAVRRGAEFFDWGALLRPLLSREEMFYRDGFHPNLVGAQALARLLSERLAPLEPKR